MACVFLLLFPAIVFSVEAMELSSRAFKDGGRIPIKYTGGGYNISPPLEWQDVPEGTQTFVLIVGDPDAPAGTWIHWLVYDIPGNERSLYPAIPAKGVLPNGMKQGRNSFRFIGYGGPYPPPGSTHRYRFTLYALNTFLDLPPGADKGYLLSRMEGHIIEKSELTGLFGR
jgi:Raf kinase inhibitor-like YbhB/YbcL family protein